VLVESLMFMMGIFLYMRATRAVDKVGRWGWWGFVALLTVVFVMNATAAPPPSVAMIASAGIIGGAVSVFLAWWVDRHRRITDAA
jgi:uncharacterized membrane-anchored protein